MTDQTIQNKQAFVVVDSNNMVQVSKYYLKRELAEEFIKEHVAKNNWTQQELAVAVFEFKEMYKMEEGV